MTDTIDQEAGLEPDGLAGAALPCTWRVPKLQIGERLSAAAAPARSILSLIHICTTITVRPSRPTLCIHLLGTRQAERDGLPLAAAAQRKPMDLLVLLAAHPACKLPVAQVIDQLWPSLEMDAPRAALDMAVSRLRKLLGQPRAVAIVDGRVQLNEALVWSDVAEFQRLLDAAGRCPDGRERQATTEQALALYRGPLLGHDLSLIHI